MKDNYESITDYRLIRRTPVIIRVDGKCCHSLKLEKPFDVDFIGAMEYAAVRLAKEMQGFKLAFVQSDEASFLLTDFDNLQTDAWFGYEIRKIVSLSASIFTLKFNRYPVMDTKDKTIEVAFDSRAFNVPREEVANYFLWRSLDWQRNSIQMLAQAHFSHKQLFQKSQADMHELLHTKGINWADLKPVEKNGTWILKDGTVRNDILPKYEDIAALVDPYLKERNTTEEEKK